MALASSIFGATIDYALVRVKRRKWWPFQPRRVTMAPTGHLNFHPRSPSYCDDFSKATPGLQMHFIHEMAHVWQAQVRGWWYLVLLGPFQRRYSYRLKPSRPLCDYGIEQQAEIAAHTLAARKGWPIPGGANRRELEDTMASARLG